MGHISYAAEAVVSIGALGREWREAGWAAVCGVVGLRKSGRVGAANDGGSVGEA